MKKEVTVKVAAVKARPASSKKVTKIYCDFCSATLPDHGSYGWYPKCSLCKRDTCRKHNNPDPNEPGDYPDWFCDICLKLFMPERAIMQEKHWKEEEALERKIAKLSLQTKL